MIKIKSKIKIKRGLTKKVKSTPLAERIDNGARRVENRPNAIIVRQTM
jgi:hypothetical protein